MSNKAVNWARNVPSLSSSEAFVLWVICDRYNEEVGMAWPSIESIARDTRLSPRTVSRALNVLAQRKLIIRKRTFSNRHGGWASNSYFLSRFPADKELLEADGLETSWGPWNEDTKFRSVDPIF